MLSTAKTQGSIDREIRRLSATIDTCATDLVATYPQAGLTVRKMPERFVFQSKDFGVTLSFFRSRSGFEIEAEAVLRVWQGEITLPGCAPRSGRGATQVSEQQFRITPCDNESWMWTDAVTTGTMDSGALAALCIETITERLDTPGSSLAAEQQDDTIS